jgi:DNA-binding LacI/PurR family transcriptional regulator/biotin operon repressor
MENMEAKLKDEKPLYERIRDSIKQQIVLGKLKPGDKLSNEIELAKTLGVGRNTVRQAISELEEQGLIERSRGRGTFIKELPPSLLPGNNLISNILFIQPRHGEGSLNNPFYHDALLALDNSIAKQGYRLTYITADNDKDLQRTNHGTKFAAVIIAGIQNRGFLDYIRPFRVPIISIHEWFPDDDVICIRVDNVLGGFLATQHLIENDRKHIAFLSGRPDNYPFTERHQGYRMAIESNGLEYNSTMVEFGGKNHLEAYHATNALLGQNACIDGIFACMDIVALGALDALKDQGLKIPEDVSLIGYDDRDFAKLLKPPLTTIRQSGKEIGETTAKVLISILSNGTVHSRDILVKPQLIVRDSTVVTK